MIDAIIEPVRAAVAILLAWCVFGAAPALAQRRGGPPSPEQGVTPAEIQRMFDSYALMQAQDFLKVGDEQFPQFLARFKALQDARRRGLQEHAQLVQQLRQLVNQQPAADEAQLKAHLKALDDAEARNGAEIKKASDAVDQILDVRQQAAFRVFEENMERRKLELVTRARQANRKQQ